MPTGLSGDTNIVIGPDPVSELQLIEARVQTVLLQVIANNWQDDLNILRNDEATRLSIPTPIPGTNN